MAFALVAILGLLPSGVNSFRQSSQLATVQQIADLITIEARQTDFDKLSATFNGLVRYYDTDGTELTGSTDPNGVCVYAAQTSIGNFTVSSGTSTTYTNLQVNNQPQIQTIAISIAHIPEGWTAAGTTAAFSLTGKVAARGDLYTRYIQVANGVNGN